MRRIAFVIVLFSIFQLQSQELNCVVIVNADQIQNTNSQVYNTLQNSILEFLNNTKWTTNNYKPQEKINCAITINILEQPSSNDFKGNMIIQASRPVYNSTYQSSILNFKDDNVSFIYNEYQPLIYNENSFESNLVSLLAFYAYTIIGMDADTFAFKGGEQYHKRAENVVNQAQQGGYSGWNRIDGNNTRYQFNENLLSPVYDDFREIMYEYHLKGLDTMSENKKDGKQAVASSLMKLQNIYLRRANAYLLRIFMDTKSDEIVDIFSDGPRIDNSAKLKEMLLKIYPTYNEKWEKIKI